MFSVNSNSGTFTHFNLKIIFIIIIIVIYYGIYSRLHKNINDTHLHLTKFWKIFKL